MKTNLFFAAALLPFLAAPVLAQDPNPATFTCGDWAGANEATKVGFLQNTKAWANDAANAPNTAKLQATILTLSDGDAMQAIDGACQGKDVGQVIVELVNQ